MLKGSRSSKTLARSTGRKAEVEKSRGREKRRLRKVEIDEREIEMGIVHKVVKSKSRFSDEEGSASVEFVLLIIL
jgi:hypothetical protein